MKTLLFSKRPKYFCLKWLVAPQAQFGPHFPYFKFGKARKCIRGINSESKSSFSNTKFRKEKSFFILKKQLNIFFLSFSSLFFDFKAQYRPIFHFIYYYYFSKIVLLFKEHEGKLKKKEYK